MTTRFLPFKALICGPRSSKTIRLRVFDAASLFINRVINFIQQDLWLNIPSLVCPTTRHLGRRVHKRQIIKIVILFIHVETCLFNHSELTDISYGHTPIFMYSTLPFRVLFFFSGFFLQVQTDNA